MLQGYLSLAVSALYDVMHISVSERSKFKIMSGVAIFNIQIVTSKEQ